MPLVLAVFTLQGALAAGAALGPMQDHHIHLRDRDHRSALPRMAGLPA
jgi:hypothetical protein